MKPTSIRKWLSITLITLLMATGVTACSPKEQPVSTDTPPEAPVTMRIATLKGPTGMGMVQLFDNQKYAMTLVNSPDEIIGKVVNKEVDIAAVPTNMASVLYNKTGKQVNILAVNTLGVLYLIENGNSIHTIKDLKGKSISTTGLGATPDYVLKYLLKKADLDPEKDVTLDYKLQHADLATALAQSEVDIAVLPEPFVTVATSKNKDLRVALDFNTEWKATSADAIELPMGCIIVDSEFAKNHPQAIEDFMKDYGASVEFVNTDPKAAAESIAKLQILPAAPIAQAAIPKSQIVLIPADKAQKSIDFFFKTLFESDPKAVGGKLPDEGIYYQSK